MAPFVCIVADPPWAPRDKLPGPTRGASRQYPVMPTSAICNLADVNPAGGLRIYGEEVADDAILFLWRLASMQEDALQVASTWGFDVKSEVVWQKLTKKGKPWFGMGRTVRASHETCLICVRGRASKVIKSKSVRSTFTAQVPVDSAGKYIHSAKPEAFFTDVVMPLVGDVPRLELFARTRREGWSSIGNQLPSVRSVDICLVSGANKLDEVASRERAFELHEQAKRRTEELSVPFRKRPQKERL